MKKTNTELDHNELDLVQDTKKLLSSVTKSTNILTARKMTPERLAEARTVLGFVNATLKAAQIKMQAFKLTGLTDKVAAIEKKSKNI